MATDQRRTAPPPTRGRAVNITLWVLQVALALFFVMAAAPKLLGDATAVEMFGTIGLGQWFRYLVGILEVAGAIGLLVPRLSGLAAFGLMGIMVGATFTQLVIIGPPVMAVTPALLIVVFALMAWGRWPQTMALVGRGAS